MTVNGLVIGANVVTLGRYYQQFVIQGPGAFVEAADDYEDFERAMRRKLLRELGVIEMSAGRVRPGGSVLAELVEADHLGLAGRGGVGVGSAGFALGPEPPASASSSWASKRRPNSTLGSTKVLIASKGTTIGSGTLPKLRVTEKRSFITARSANQSCRTMVISLG